MSDIDYAKFKKGFIQEPKVVKDLLHNHKHLLKSYAQILQSMYDENEEEITQCASSENPEVDLKTLKNTQQKLVEAIEYIPTLQAENEKEAKDLAAFLDKAFEIETENLSISAEYGCCQVGFSIDGKKEFDFRATFTKAHWPTDKEEVAPTCIALEVQRMARKTDLFHWSRGEDTI